MANDFGASGFAKDLARQSRQFNNDLNRQQRQQQRQLLKATSLKSTTNPWAPPRQTTSGRDPRRGFRITQQKQIWAQQNGKCASCKKRLNPLSTQYDHIKPWADKGRTLKENGAALCSNCHSEKTSNERLTKLEKKKRQPRNDNSSFF